MCGTPTTDPADLAYVPGNNCHPDRIASPDNVVYIPEHDMVGGGHRARTCLSLLHGHTRVLWAHRTNSRMRFSPVWLRTPQLMIGEDTSEHQNDVIWAYDMETAALTRILTTPYGAETTSPYWYPNLGGYAYLTAAVQHPYGRRLCTPQRYSS